MQAGYLTDVAYTGEFHDHLAPAWLDYIAAINGYATRPLDRHFTWCDLGCGKGITSLLLAATHPQGEFHATDLNPAHIEYAERLRSAAAVDNLKLRAQSFAETLQSDLPAFDFIVLHGVYSWVPDTAREEIHRLLRTKLKPGGLAMVSYNAMPGWAALQPIRQMMHDYAQTIPGDSIAKARAAYAYVEALAKSGAGYFASAPAAAAHLQEIAAQDIRYVAHEYITSHAEPFYVAQVARAMSSTGLSFAGSMTAVENYIDWIVPSQLRGLAGAAPDRVMSETHLDFVANTRFRRDLFTAQPPRARPASVPLSAFDPVHFCLADLPERLSRRKVPPLLQQYLQSSAQPADALYACLAEGPTDARELHRALGSGSEDGTSSLLQALVAARHVLPCAPLRAAPGWLSANTALIDAGLREQIPRIPLACRATGGASYCEVVYASAIEAASQFEHEGAAAAAVLTRLRLHEHPVNRRTVAGDTRAATDDEVREYVMATWRTLHDPAHADGRLLRLLGILS